MRPADLSGCPGPAGWLPRAVTRTVCAAISAGLALGCGVDVPVTHEDMKPSTTAGTPAAGTEVVAGDEGGGGQAGSGPERPHDGADSGVPTALDNACPDNASVFQTLNDATYAVVLEVITGTEEYAYLTYATAFAINEFTLATNAHVADIATPFPIRRILAVQSGTGAVKTLVATYVHPIHNGDPIGSPDVALFKSREPLQTYVPIASAEDLLELELGDDLVMAGFPGDVDSALPFIPGETVPQATMLTGHVSARRNYTQTAITPDNVDYIQHDAPATPGTSGSALMHCGAVVGINNAGTVRKVVVVGADGELTTTRQATAANNFGVHAKYLQEALDLVEHGAIVGSELPPQWNPLAQFAGEYRGSATGPGRDHDIVLTIEEDGRVHGYAHWGDKDIPLEGEIDDAGMLMMLDRGNPRGGYAGEADPGTDTISGAYFEQDEDTEEWLGPLAEWTVRR